MPPPAPSLPEPRDASLHSSAPPSLQERLEFLQLTDDDARHLHALKATFDQWADRFVSRFYAQLSAHAVTAQFLKDAQRVERLKELQKQHLRTLLESDWDDSYVEQRRRVGKRHAEVGLEPIWFCGAYNQYMQFMSDELSADQSAETRQFAARLTALSKALVLDMGLALEAYFSQSTQQLRDALNMYWQANDDLRRLTQVTSHDLKTPLATVANLCEEALDEFGDRIPPAAADLIRSARDHTYRNCRTIDELLESSMASSNDATQSIDSRQAIEEAVQRVRRSLEFAKIQLILPASYPHVRGNTRRLREVIVNLLSNAIKFIDKSPGIIRISVRKRNDEVEFRVHDNGPGIPDDEQERIFTPFQRMRDHSRVPGSGLGLYFAKELVDRDGGRIWVESVIGEGSCFIVRLKAASDLDG